MAIRGPEELQRRENALSLCTLGSAWFVYDAARRNCSQIGSIICA